MHKFAGLIGIFLLSGCFWSSQTPKTIRILGETMGTTYRVTVVDAPDALTQENLSEGITATLATVNAKMSNWDPASEVSQFNKRQSTDPAQISEAFVHVLAAAHDIHLQSDGKFDITLAPLINLWGFGPKTPDAAVPSDKDIETARSLVGQDRYLTLNATARTLQKHQAGISVNLSAIAKGYGVDAVAEYLRENGIERYLVEIGGDLITAGLNPEGKAWSIGIEKPDAAKSTVQTILNLSDQAMATSGDYRNFNEYDGVRYSHIIDPTTGRPILHRTASVTVLADTAMAADGWATAMLVLGDQVGMSLAEKHGIAVLFITKGENLFTTSTSSLFELQTKTDS
ncbi:MAG: FAD:protein FMN transferase [Marinovum sp.]|jgi:thiamine biosynthesis lipoprotein|nr:FAD:protein FMN transferase [Marinovum sp.]